MIIANLKGGLGNQMFQYALGRSLSLKNGSDLKLDTTGLDRANKVGDIYRPFALDAFAIEKHIASPEEIQRLKYPFGALSKAVRLIRARVLKQAHIGFEPEMLNKTGDVYLDGFWQSPKYFEDIRDALLMDFTLTDPLSSKARTMADRIATTSSVSLHVRRGDYVANPKNTAVHGTCSLGYYKGAVASIAQQVKNPVWFVFSDDIPWVQENLGLEGETIFVSGSGISDAEEIVLMSLCKHNIIANSSFSWWGAWLNTNPDKIVIAPTPWFNTKKDHHMDLIPTSWTTLLRNQ